MCFFNSVLQILKKHCKREGTDYDKIVKGTTFRVVLGSEKEINAKIEKRAKEYHLPVEPMKSRLGLGAGKPSEVADRFKELFDNGLGLVTLSFISMNDIPVFAEEVISQFR